VQLIGFKTTLAAILTSGGEIIGTDGDRIIVRDGDGNQWSERNHVARSNGDIDVIMARCDGFPRQQDLFF